MVREVFRCVRIKCQDPRRFLERELSHRELQYSMLTHKCCTQFGPEPRLERPLSGAGFPRGC